MYLSRHGGEAPRLKLSREGVALTPAQRRILADVLRAANSVTGFWARPDMLPESACMSAVLPSILHCFHCCRANKQATCRRLERKDAY